MKFHGYWFLGIPVLIFSLYGAFKISNAKKIILPLLILNIALICYTGVKTDVWNRHFVSFQVFMIIGLYSGIYYFLKEIIKTRPMPSAFKIIGIVAVFLFFVLQLNKLHEDATNEYVDLQKDYIELCDYVKENISDSTIFCSRKPEIFYFFTQTKCVSYLWSTKPEDVVTDLLKKKISYIVVDVFPFSSNEKYLYPTIMKYQSLFIPIKSFGNSGTTLARFNIEEAKKILNKKL
jgi:hypothetical protein